MLVDNRGKKRCSKNSSVCRRVNITFSYTLNTDYGQVFFFFFNPLSCFFHKQLRFLTMPYFPLLCLHAIYTIIPDCNISIFSLFLFGQFVTKRASKMNTKISIFRFVKKRGGVGCWCSRVKNPRNKSASIVPEIRK